MVWLFWKKVQNWSKRYGKVYHIVHKVVTVTREFTHEKENAARFVLVF